MEGLAREDRPSPIQEAFLAKHGLQCGFCTPGLLMAATALLEKNPNPDEDEIRRGISGNICRCTGYVKVIESVQLAARAISKSEKRAPARMRKGSGKRS